MYEHEYNVSKKDIRSVIYNHCEEFGHSFDFKKPKVLDTEPSLFKREFSEMLHIHNTPLNINRKLDTQNLRYIYKKSLSLITNSKPPPHRSSLS